jgi:Ca2+-binding RTX toxin-like protein
VIFGDQGEILRTASTESAPNYLVRARSIGFEFGGDNTIHTGLGDKVIVGGFGGDVITAATAGANDATGNSVRIIAGDHAQVDFDSLGRMTNFISLDAENAGNGGADTIQIGHGSDTVARSLGENFILGGMAGDTILVSAHRVGDDWVQGAAVSTDVIFGDQGEIVRTASSEGVPNYLQHVHSIGFALGGNNTIHTGLGDKVIVGGFGGDVMAGHSGLGAGSETAGQHGRDLW